MKFFLERMRLSWKYFWYPIAGIFSLGPICMVSADDFAADIVRMVIGLAVIWGIAILLRKYTDSWGLYINGDQIYYKTS